MDELIEDSFFITCVRAYRDINSPKIKLPDSKKHLNKSGRLIRDSYLSKFSQLSGACIIKTKEYVESQTKIKKNNYRKKVHFKDFMSFFLGSQKSIKALKSNMGEPQIKVAFLAVKRAHNYKVHSFWKDLIKEFSK